MRRLLLAVALLVVGLAAFTVYTPTASAQGTGQTAEITAAALNVRSGPGTNYRIIGTARRGETYAVQQTSNGWVNITWNGQAGWVSASYVRLSSGTPAASAPSTPATGGTTPAPAAGSATGKIVFATNPGGAIYTLNANGTNLRQVGSGLDPAWSPDGTRIAYADWVTPEGIYVMNADGSNKSRIGEQVLSKAPSWSPDGNSIIFTYQHGGQLEEEERCFFGFCFTIPKDPYWKLAVLTVSTKAFREPQSDFHSFSPVWRSNGDVLFDGDKGLAVVNPNSENLPTTIASDQRITDPRECGSKIASTFHQHDHWEIYTLNTDGAGLKRLTGSDSILAGPTYDNVAPEWSPDCSTIIFLTNRDGRWRPYSMNADGSNQQPFLPTVFDSIRFDYGYASDRVFDWTK